MESNEINSLPSNHLQMFVLDVLQHDVAEQLDSILKLINNVGCIGWREFWPRDFERQEVLSALGDLVGLGFVTIYQESAENAELVATDLRNLLKDSSECWYGRSTAGVAAWKSWDPPTSSDN